MGSSPIFGDTPIPFQVPRGLSREPRRRRYHRPLLIGASSTSKSISSAYSSGRLFTLEEVTLEF